MISGALPITAFAIDAVTSGAPVLMAQVPPDVPPGEEPPKKGEPPKREERQRKQEGERPQREQRQGGERPQREQRQGGEGGQRSDQPSGERPPRPQRQEPAQREAPPAPREAPPRPARPLRRPFSVKLPRSVTCRLSRAMPRRPAPSDREQARRLHAANSVPTSARIAASASPMLRRHRPL